MTRTRLSSARTSWPTRVLVSLAFVAGVVAVTGALAVTVNDGPRTARSRNLLFTWSDADPEAVVAVQWDPGGHPDGAPNLTATYSVGGCPSGSFASEFWGNSWAGGAPQDGDPVLVGLDPEAPEGAVAWAPAFGRKGVQIRSRSTDCSLRPVAAQVPVTTRYRFYDDGPRANVVRVDRDIDFRERPLDRAFRPYIPRLSPTSLFDRVLYPLLGGGLANVPVVTWTGVRPDWDAAQGWFAIDGPSGTGILLRRAASAVDASLWMDDDGFSFSNATSFLLQPPEGGFAGRVREKMVLCFFDDAIWPVSEREALRLPAGCDLDD